jgi:hypothetical protein
MYRMAWTDERMDDFAKHTDRRFDAVDQRFEAVDQRLDRLERRVDEGFDRMDRRLDDVYHLVQRTMFQLGVGLIATVGLGLFGAIATH